MFNEEKPINVTVECRRKLSPELALIVYREEPNFYSSDRACEVIQFEITEHGEFIKPKALDIRCMQDIFNSANGNAAMEFLDTRILALNNSSIVWYEPSRRAEIFFDCTEANRKDLNELCKGKKIRWPALLFKLNHGALYCRALADNRRPTLKSKLYVAPFTHINPVNGHVCTPRHLNFDPRISMTANMQKYSEGFYHGIFGHATDGELTTHPGGHDGLWREILQASGNRRFPNQYLKETSKTLQDFLR